MACLCLEFVGMCANFSFDFSSENRFKCECVGLQSSEVPLIHFNLPRKQVIRLVAVFRCICKTARAPHCRAPKGFVPKRSLNQSENGCTLEIEMPFERCSDLLYGKILSECQWFTLIKTPFFIRCSSILIVKPILLLTNRAKPIAMEMCTRQIKNIFLVCC